MPNSLCLSVSSGRDARATSRIAVICSSVASRSAAGAVADNPGASGACEDEASGAGVIAAVIGEAVGAAAEAMLAAGGSVACAMRAVVAGAVADKAASNGSAEGSATLAISVGAAVVAGRENTARPD